MKSLNAAAAFCSVLALSTPALAQQTGATENANEGDTIIVSAQRRDQRLQDVPVTITALSGDTLANRGVDKPDAIFSQVPGVALQSPSGSAGFPIYSVRGVSLLDFSYTSESPVAVYVDDVYQGNTALFAQPLYDMERVEVLKGPQGTLYGRNTTGGLVHFITKRPTAVQEGNAYLSYGRFNEAIVGGAVSGPVTDSVRVRLSGQYKQNDGWQTNLINGDKFGKIDHNVSTRLQVDADLTENVNLLLVGDYTDAKGVNDLRTFRGFREPTDFTVRCSDDRILASECVNGAGFGIPNPNPREGYSNKSPDDVSYSVELYGLTGYLTWNLGFANLTSITAYKHGEKTDATDLDAAAVAPSSLLFSTAGRHEQFSQELRLSGDIDRLKWLVGGFYYSDDRFYGNGLPDLGIGNWSDQKIESWSGFADVTFAVTDAINLTGGLRYTKDDKDVDLNYVSPPLVGTRDGTLIFNFNDSINANKLTWRAVADWHVTPDVMLFTGVSTGFKSGGYNTTTVTSPTAAGPVNPERNTQYEVGMKSAWFDRMMTLNLTGYYIDWRDIQATATVASTTPGTPIVSLYQNIGNADILGVEGELVVRPSRDLTFTLGAAYNDTEVSSPPTITIGGLTLDGNVLANAPKTSVNGAVNYEPELPNGSRLLFGAEVARQSAKFFRPDNVFYSRQPSYTLVDARVGWASQNDRFRVTLFGKNLFDKEYFVSATGTPDAAEYQWGQPRTFGIKFEAKM